LNCSFITEKLPVDRWRTPRRRKFENLFAGLRLFPFGLLVYKSRFLPRLLEVWLMIAGIVYTL